MPGWDIYLKSKGPAGCQDAMSPIPGVATPLRQGPGTVRPKNSIGGETDGSVFNFTIENQRLRAFYILWAKKRGLG
jgi:hypothetical protein